MNSGSCKLRSDMTTGFQSIPWGLQTVAMQPWCVMMDESIIQPKQPEQMVRQPRPCESWPTYIANELIKLA